MSSFDLLGFGYGVHLALLVYLFSYLTVWATFNSRGFSVLIVGVKYFVYWKAVTFGFHYLPAAAIVVGSVFGFYGALPALIWVNKRMNQKESEMVTQEIAHAENAPKDEPSGR